VVAEFDPSHDLLRSSIEVPQFGLSVAIQSLASLLAFVKLSMLRHRDTIVAWLRTRWNREADRSKPVSTSNINLSSKR
jgi:hypothetical protein